MEFLSSLDKKRKKNHYEVKNLIPKQQQWTRSYTGGIFNSQSFTLYFLIGQLNKNNLKIL